MANECDFYMKVKGKEETVMEFADILKDRYREKGIYFNGISDTDIIAEESDADGILKVEIAGYCVWFVKSSMRKEDRKTSSGHRGLFRRTRICLSGARGYPERYGGD